MKTNKNYLLILSFAFLLFACGSDNAEGTNGNEDEVSVENGKTEGEEEFEAENPPIDLSNVPQECLDKLKEYEAFVDEMHEFKVNKYEKDKEKYFDEYMDYMSENSSWGTDDVLVECSDDMNVFGEIMRIKAKY